MYRVLVILKIVNFDALNEFESKASAVMARYSGTIAGAYETVRNADGTGEEFHLLEFADEASFYSYRKDPWHQDNSKLRESAISSTEIFPDVLPKTY